MVNGFDDQLQLRFPEGKMFSNAIFSLAIIDYCVKRNMIDISHAQIVDRNIGRLLSEYALQPFNSDMYPKYGMFYNGWSLLVLKRYQKSYLFELSSIKEQVRGESQLIEQRLIKEQKDSLRILESYSGLNWPADNLIGLIALDDITIQEEWLNELFRVSNHKSGLINHIGTESSLIRGSSQALITYCLNEMDYKDIKKYNREFHHKFIDNYLGIQLVRENEDGSNSMDVDSGPVIFGYGASGTIMNIKTQSSVNEGSSKLTWAAFNAISLPINIWSKKYYLLKKEPMFDIFMLWASVELE